MAFFRSKEKPGEVPSVILKTVIRNDRNEQINENAGICYVPANSHPVSYEPNTSHFPQTVMRRVTFSSDQEDGELRIPVVITKDNAEFLIQKREGKEKKGFPDRT